MVDTSACKLYELFAAVKSGGQWRAGSGAVWNLRSNALRPGRLDERRRGRPADLPRPRPLGRRLGRRDQPRPAVHGARHLRALHLPGPPRRRRAARAGLPPMGLRVRLKASFDISGYGSQARILLTALKSTA